ncbi:hypothetical protein JCM8097_005380 [Rhodosporidiobolus ruineniae]
MPPRSTRPRRAATRAYTGADDSSADAHGAPLARVPDRVFALADTPTVHLLPSHQPGYLVQADLYFRSKEWIEPLRKDVGALLEAFEEGCQLSSSAEVEGAREVEAEVRSPMSVMRECWTRLGWTNVHLLGVPEGPLRGRWGDSVVRAFVERFNDPAPLKQVGALLALCAFWSTQIESVEKFFVKVEPVTLEHLLTFPSAHAAQLDSLFPSSDSSPSGSYDLLFTLHCLLSSSAFFLLPSEVYSHPHLPTVALQSAAERGQDRDVALLLLAAEREADALRQGELSKVARRAMMTAAEAAAEDGEEEEEEEEAAEEDEDEEERRERRVSGSPRGAGPDLPLWGTERISALAGEYEQAKNAGGGAGETGEDAGEAAAGAGRISTLLRPRNKVQMDVLRQAEEAAQASLYRYPAPV